MEIKKEKIRNFLLEHNIDYIDKEENANISFGSFKTNLLLNSLQNIETFIRNGPYDYLANIFPKENYKKATVKFRSSKSRRVKLAPVSLPIEKVYNKQGSVQSLTQTRFNSAKKSTRSAPVKSFFSSRNYNSIIDFLCNWFVNLC